MQNDGFPAVSDLTQLQTRLRSSPSPWVRQPSRILACLAPNLIIHLVGPDMCIAKTFAMQEMRLCLSRLVMTFDMSLPEGFDRDGFYKGLRNMRTTLLDKPLVVKLTRREGRQTPIDAY